MAGSLETYLAQLLQLHWLRPETALWRSFDCLLMEKYGTIAGRSVDLGCGDGTLSFVMAGGKIDDYDIFRDVSQLDHYNDGADIYDSEAQPMLDVVSSALRHRYQLGVDHKATLVSKAKRFGSFYDDLLVHDLNRSLPVGDGSIDTAFSNILYWLDDPSLCLMDWCRTLKAKGRLCLFVPAERFREKTWLYNNAPHVGSHRYLNFLDRGYAALIRHCLNTGQWVGIFERAGLSVVSHHRYLSEPVTEIWNIGTRPIAPLLIKMAGRLAPEDRATLKAEWVDYFTKFFLPILGGEFDRPLSEEESGFHFFVLEQA